MTNTSDIPTPEMDMASDFTELVVALARAAVGVTSVSVEYITPERSKRFKVSLDPLHMDGRVMVGDRYPRA